MKRLVLAAFLLLLCASGAAAQTTSVTFQATDADGQTWNNGTWTAVLSSPPGVNPGPYVIAGTSTPVPNQSQTGTLNGTGNGSLTVTPNTAIAPALSVWTFSICPQATPSACIQQSFSIFGASQVLTFVLPGIRISLANPTVRVTAYQDAELSGGSLGSLYYNLPSAAYRVCTGIAFGNCNVWSSISAAGGLGIGTQYNSSTPAGLPSFTNFCPSGINPTGIFQRADATYASFVGVDETTLPGGLQAGTVTDCHRHFFNDTSVPIFMRNALVSIYHTYGNGNTTSTNADDRALAIRTETSASISGGFANSRFEGIYGETGIKGAPTSFGSGPDQGQDGIRWVIDDQHNSTLITTSQAITGAYTQSVATAVYSGCQVCGIGVKGQLNMAAAANNNNVFFAAFSVATQNSGGATNTSAVDYDAPYSTSGNFTTQWGLWGHGSYRTSDWFIINDTVAPVNLGATGLFTGAISSTGGSIPVSSSLTGASAFTTTLIAAPIAPSVSNSGTPGGTTYSYVLCAKDGNAGGVCGATGTTTTGNATLNTSNFNSLSFTGFNSVSSYDVFRTVGGVIGKLANVPVGAVSSGTGWLATCTLNRGANTTCTFSDQGATGDATTPPVLNTTAGITASGTILAPYIGPGNNWAFVDGKRFTSTAQIADLAEDFPTNDGVVTQVIYSPPEDITTSPWPVNFAPEWRLLPCNTKSTVSTSAAPCSIVLDTPMPLGANSTVVGLGPVGTGGNYSGATSIITGQNYPTIVGFPTEGTITCTGVGALTGTFPLAVRMEVNLNQGSHGAARPGHSAYVKQSVTCSSNLTITVPTPTGGNAGSLTKRDFQVGYDPTGAGVYYLQVPGSGLTCNVTGTVDALNDCSLTGTNATMTALQTGTVPFETDLSVAGGAPIDTSNAAIIIGPGANVSFATQFRDLSIACPATGHGAGNPNVLIWNQSGQELTGSTGILTLYGDCGGYTNISGAFILSGASTPNSSWAHIQFSGGPTSGATPFRCIILDGNGSVGYQGSGTGASGNARQLDDISCNLRGGGTGDIGLVAQGFRTKVGISNWHSEIQNGNDVIYSTTGARGSLVNVEGFTTGNFIHLTSTSGEWSGNEICAQGTNPSTLNRCTTGAVVIQDDTDLSGDQPLLTVVGQWASGTSKSNVGNLTVAGAMKFLNVAQIGTDTGTGAAYVVNNLNPQMLSLVNGVNFCFLPANANSNGAPTLNVNGLSAAVTIAKANGALATNLDMLTTKNACVQYDATLGKWILLNPASATGTGTGVLATAPTFITKLTVPRVIVDNATTLVAGDFVLNASWGTTASTAITVTTSKDSAAVITVTSAGTGQAANPTIAFTFHDGTWTQVPACIAIQTGGTGIFGDTTVTARSATAYTWQWNATPTATQTYEFTIHCLGT